MEGANSEKDTYRKEDFEEAWRNEDSERYLKSAREMYPGEVLQVQKFQRSVWASYLYRLAEGGNREIMPSLVDLKRAAAGVRVTAPNDGVYPFSPHPNCATCPTPQKDCGLGGQLAGL